MLSKTEHYKLHELELEEIRAINMRSATFATPSSHPLMTSPQPILNLNGLPRERELSTWNHSKLSTEKTKTLRNKTTKKEIVLELLK